MGDAERVRHRAWFWIGLALAVVGTPLCAASGLVAVYASDVCSPNSPSYYCGGDGQTLGVWIGLAGAALLPVLAVAGLVAPRGSAFWRSWPACVLGGQFATYVAISVLASKVS